jgi:hypothetical protein
MMVMMKATWMLAAGGTALVVAAQYHDFDLQTAPGAPPLASIVSSSTATGGHVWDAIADRPIDVRPSYGVLIRMR